MGVPKCPHFLEYFRPFMGIPSNEDFGESSRVFLTSVNMGNVWKILGLGGGFLEKLVHKYTRYFYNILDT